MLVTITNDYHNTDTRVRVGRMTAKNARRVRDRLCGCDGCTCSHSDLGTRGSQRTDDGRRIAIEPVSGDGDVAVTLVDHE